MKKQTVILFILTLIAVSPCIAQKNSYGLSIAAGKGAVLKQALEGGPGYNLNVGYSIGLHFNRKLTERLKFNTGITWYSNSVSVTPNFYPGIDMRPTNYSVQLIYVPIFLKANLSKYFFLNGGLIGDIDVSGNNYITPQSGLGAGLGLGVSVQISKRTCLELNPYLNFHGLMLAKGDSYPERVLDSGVKLNVVFQ